MPLPVRAGGMALPAGAEQIAQPRGAGRGEGPARCGGNDSRLGVVYLQQLERRGRTGDRRAGLPRRPALAGEAPL